MTTLVLVAQGADLRQRASLDRALRLHPAPIAAVDVTERWSAARRAAAEGDCDWIAFVDEDVVPVADAFGALQRAFAQRPAIVGGRGIVAGEQRFGEMFGPPRWGPDPADLTSVSAPEALRTTPEAMRGPIDVVPRGLVFVSAAFVREAGDDVDPWALHLDLAVRARRRGLLTLCEPRMTFTTRPDPPVVVQHVPRLLRAAAADWPPGELHRHPLAARERVIGREVRVSGNVRGYERRPYPPVAVLLVGEGVAPKALSALRSATGADEVATCRAGDGEELRRRLQATGDRYLLVVDARQAIDRADYVALVERLERSGRFALALDADDPPFAAALFHLGRIPADARFDGNDVAAVIAAAAARLPEQRLFAVRPGGIVADPTLPAVPPARSLTFVMLATARPGVSRQTFDALSQAIGTSPTIAVVPSGAATMRKVLSAWSGTRIVEDDVDPNLGAALNRVLGQVETDLVFVVRDDVQVPRTSVARLQAAFERIAGLGAAGPRINAPELPQGLADVEYRDLADMETFAERRAAAYAREAALVPALFAPALVISRRVLATIGGFDPTLGFTRYGILDFTQRLNAANIPLACCDDAFVHLFPAVASESLLAGADVSPALASVFARRSRGRTGFDPARDRIPVGAVASVVARRASGLTVVVPVADSLEWERVKPTLGALVVAFTAEDPVEIAIGLDGSFDVQHAVGAMRELLAEAPVPLERTVNVRIEPITDAASWVRAPARPVRLAETTREGLAAIPPVDGVPALRAVLAEPR